MSIVEQPPARHRYDSGMALDTLTFHNDCRTVAIGGIRYDFASAEDAAYFVRTVESGTPPRLVYSLLMDQRIFRRSLQ